MGLPAPGFVRETLDGRELALSHLRGKPVVMNFWASWCVPCRAEAPTLAEAARTYRASVHFLGVNVLDDLPSARRFVEQYSWPFPSVVDEDGSLLRLYRVVGLPTTLFLTPQGRVARVHAGPFVGPEGSRRLRALIAELLAMP